MIEADKLPAGDQLITEGSRPHLVYDSFLFSLEIRQEIYKYLLVPGTFTIIRGLCGRFRPYTSDRTFVAKNPKRQLASWLQDRYQDLYPFNSNAKTLYTCRQINREAMEIMLTQKKFLITNISRLSAMYTICKPVYPQNPGLLRSIQVPILTYTETEHLS